MAQNRSFQAEVITAAEDVARFDARLGKEHYLRQAPPVGDFLRQVVVRRGQWVGLLVWGPCSYALQDRDEWIGWTGPLRAQRQKLIVQNRRFLVPKQAREPNLASQVQACALRALPQQWHAQFGYSPVLAESFTDIELFEGTCYKASGWLPVGLTKGYRRHRADFFQHHGRPKKLWLKPLGKLSPEQVRAVLCGPLPQVCRAGAKSNANGLLPIPEPMVYSLAQALQRVCDPRRNNRSFRCGTLLCIVAMALLSGCRTIAEIHRFGQRLKPKQRARLGLPRNPKYPKLHAVPSYHVYYNLLSKLALEEFAQVLTQWLQAGRDRLPKALALDGKMIRDIVGVLSLSEHDTGVPVAVAIQSEKKGDGEHCELQVAKRMLAAQTGILDGALVTTDALHTLKPNAINVTNQGGDVLLQVRGNRPKLRALAARKAAATPLLPCRRRNPRPAAVSSST